MPNGGLWNKENSSHANVTKCNRYVALFIIAVWETQKLRKK